MILAEYIDELAVEILGVRHDLIEERIRILLRPKPRWLPQRLWKLLVARLLVIETKTL